MGTIRHQIAQLLVEQEMNAIDLSKSLAIREKEVYEHLPHIARSVGAQGKKLILNASECLACGYVFENRKRFTRPSRCPKCKATHITRPTYRIR
jgi:predicted Zn-ribbon and HTH transcriptional regulator